MHKAIKKVLMKIIILGALLSSLGAHASADSFISNKSQVVQGSEIEYIYTRDKGTLKIGFESPSGALYEESFDLDTDSGYLRGSIPADEVGSYKSTYLLIDGEEAENPGLTFQVVGDLADIYPQASDIAIIDEMPEEIDQEDLVQGLTKVRFYDRLGDPIDLDIEITDGLDTYYFQTDSDGFTASTGVLTDKDLLPGTYQASFSGGGQTHTKTLTIRGQDNSLSGQITKLARLAGANRTETAIAISKRINPAGKKAVLVDSDSFTNTLAGSSLAAAIDGPILFTGRASLDKATGAELTRLGIKEVYILGSMDKNVEAGLSKLGIGVQKLGTGSGIQVANQVAREMKKISSYSSVILANVDDYPDALAASPYAGKNKMPILFTKTGGLDQATLDTMKSQGVKDVIVVGGPNSVSETVLGQIRSNGMGVSRIAGSNRYETAYEFAKKFFPSFKNMIIASGETWPDAIVGGTLGAKFDAPIYLTQAKTLHSYIKTDLIKTKEANVFVLGGTKTITDPVYNEVYKILAKMAYKINRPEDIRKTGGPIKIFLDQGHGWNYNKGVVSGYYEGNAMYWYGLILRNELRQYGFIVDCIRNDLEAERLYCVNNGIFSTNGESVSLRGPKVAGYDILISLHTNANYNASVRGTEVYDSCQSTTYELAKALTDTIAAHFNHPNRGVRYRFNVGNGPIVNGRLSEEKLGEDWYGVLRTSKADRAMMLEQGFHSNKEDCSLLMDANFKKEMAAKSAKVIGDYFGYSK